MTLLRHYQREAIDAVHAYWSGGGGSPLIDLATGTGKSVVLAEICRHYVTEYDCRIIVLTHVKELVEQDLRETLRLWPQCPAGVNSAGLGRRDMRSKVLFASIQSIHRHGPETLGDADIIIIDECFPTGTPVMTPFGEKPIEHIRPGDFVANATGFGIVRACSARKTRSLIRLELSNGTTIRCTENHPIFTQSGWKKASELEVGNCLYNFENVRTLRKNNEALDKARHVWRDGFMHETECMGKTEILLNLVLEAEREPNAVCEVAFQDAGNIETNRPQAIDSRRQRNGANDTTVRIVGKTTPGLDSRICYPDENQKGARISDLLQAGSGQPRVDDWDRIRREYTYWEASHGRQEERRSSGFARVARISREEYESDQVVYNLHVSGHPSYFAHGFLVHNCHLVPRDGDGMYLKFIARMRAGNPELRVLGLTATPYRLDSGRLDAKGGIFDDVIYSYGIGEGVRDGYLAPLKSRNAVHGQIDASGVAKSGGEFKPGALESAANTDALVREAVADIIERGQGRKGWIVFCSGVDHCKAVRDELARHGVAAAAVTGETSSGDRDRAIRDFKAGQLRALVSMNVLTVGFNAPHVDLIAMLRPTLSTGLYVQMLGRGTRLAPGKTDCLVLDFSGNVRRHGPVDAIEIKGGSGGGSKEEAKVSESTVRAKACPRCQVLVGLRAMECDGCGHVWPVDPKHDAKADRDAAVMSRELEQQWLTVDSISASAHVSQASGNTSLRVDYLVGFKLYSEWIGLDSMGWARERAGHWWRLMTRAKSADGVSVDIAAQELRDGLSTIDCIAIRVRRDGKFWRVIDRMRADGTAVNDKMSVRMVEKMKEVA